MTVNKMHTVLLGMSSNIGNPSENIEIAIDKLNQISKIEKRSSNYKTEPIGYLDQDWFINICLEVRTDLSPQELLNAIQKIELGMGRERLIENGPRIIDIDILFYDDIVLEEENLLIPHPEIANRNFVLSPLAEIAPKRLHPQNNKSVETMLKELKNPDQAIRI